MLTPEDVSDAISSFSIVGTCDNPQKVFAPQKKWGKEDLNYIFNEITRSMDVIQQIHKQILQKTSQKNSVKHYTKNLREISILIFAISDGKKK